MIEVNWTFQAKPIRVVDGDTIVLLVDNGFRNREEHSIRLLGVDTPEVFSGPPEERARGKQAAGVTQAWITEVGAKSDSEFPLLLRTDRDKTTFNRYLGEVWSKSGECLNQHLIERGYGAKPG